MIFLLIGLQLLPLTSVKLSKTRKLTPRNLRRLPKQWTYLTRCKHDRKYSEHLRMEKESKSKNNSNSQYITRSKIIKFQKLCRIIVILRKKILLLKKKKRNRKTQITQHLYLSLKSQELRPKRKRKKKDEYYIINFINFFLNKVFFYFI